MYGFEKHKATQHREECHSRVLGWQHFVMTKTLQTGVFAKYKDGKIQTTKNFPKSNQNLLQI